MDKVQVNKKKLKARFSLVTLKRWLEVINPRLVIGGLEVSDAALRYVAIKDGKIIKAFLKLPTGIIVNGEIKDKKKAVQALLALRKQLGIGTAKPMSVVASISTANVYTQLFGLPLVARGRLEEAARLNLQMISPIDVNEAYYDWQQITDEITPDGKFNLLGAFVSRRLIDDLAVVLLEANLVAVAIEPLPMSIARVARNNMAEAMERPQMVFDLNSDGLNFFILKQGQLLFNHFISWLGIREREQAKELSMTLVKEAVTREIRRLLNFYTSKWGEVIEEMILISATQNKELMVEIGNNFNLKIKDLVLTSKYPELTIAWATAFGAALRGLVPRRTDNDISLASIGTENLYQQSRFLNFSLFWRNIVITITAAVLLFYGGVDLLVMLRFNELNDKLAATPVAISEDEVRKLEQSAIEFNNLVSKTLLAKGQSIDWSPLFKQLRSLAGTNVSLQQIQIQVGDPIAISVGGDAVTERAVLDFKNKLIRESNFTEVKLPLTAIEVNPGGTAGFKVTFKVKEWPIK